MLILEPADTAQEGEPEVTVDSCLRSSAQGTTAAKKSQQNVGQHQEECRRVDRRTKGVILLLCVASVCHAPSPASTPGLPWRDPRRRLH